MKDPKTTIPGIIALAVAVLTYVSQFITSHAWPPSLAQIALAAVGIVGIFAKDAQPTPPTP